MDKEDLKELGKYILKKASDPNEWAKVKMDKALKDLEKMDE